MKKLLLFLVTFFGSLQSMEQKELVVPPINEVTINNQKENDIPSLLKLSAKACAREYNYIFDQVLSNEKIGFITDHPDLPPMLAPLLLKDKLVGLPKKITVCNSNADEINALAVHPNKTNIVTGDDNGDLIFFDTQSMNAINKIQLNSPINALHYNNDGDKIIFITLDNSGYYDSVKKIIQYFPSRCQVRSAKFTTDGSKIIYVTEEGRRAQFDVVNNALVAENVQAHDNVIFAVQTHPAHDGDATCSADGMVKLWKNNALKFQLFGHEDMVRVVNYSPDGNRLISGSDDGKILLWNTIDGKLVHQLIKHTDWIRALNYDRFGNRIVSASDDRTAGIWDAHSGKIIHQLKAHKAGVLDAKFNESGDLVATAGADYKIGLWNSGTGELLLSCLGHSDKVVAVSFINDHSLVSVGFDKKVGFWQLMDDEYLTKYIGVRRGLFIHHLFNQNKVKLTSELELFKQLPIELQKVLIDQHKVVDPYQKKSRWRFGW
ncbi:MAG: WD domain, G-beta repeat [Candidatus Dependentiae bacterium ADurb.Bin331]|nr:MAG: WD domain, G-beta repeat [Candidatus Dependentiae bacterium ADurb.Bin331]